MRPLHQIIKKPLITEKTSQLKEDNQVVAFEVSMTANKVEIKQAIEKAFDVKVTNKVKRVGLKFGKRSNRKKAFVTLAEGSNIDFFGV